MQRHASRFLAEVDPVLGKIIARTGACSLKAKRRDPFHSIGQAILYQQLNGKAAETIMKRFCRLFDSDSFPTPQDVAGATLELMRKAGVSKQKGTYLLDLARRASDGALPTLAECDRLEDEEIINRLTVVKGVGRWTAEMFLMFNLGRPDVLPVGDYGLRRGFMVAYGKRKMPEPGQLQRHGERWKPHRTVASWYLWRALDAPAE